MIRHVLRKQESPFLRAGKAEVEGLTRKWTEILEFAVGIGRGSRTGGRHGERQARLIRGFPGIFRADHSSRFGSFNPLAYNDL